MIKNAAATAVNKGQHSSYYGDDNGNPVFASLEQEIHLFQNNLRKHMANEHTEQNVESLARQYVLAFLQNKICARCIKVNSKKYFYLLFRSDTLNGLWNRFEHRLPRLMYFDKLLDMGDFLMSVKVWMEMSFVIV